MQTKQKNLALDDLETGVGNANSDPYEGMSNIVATTLEKRIQKLMSKYQNDKLLLSAIPLNHIEDFEIGIIVTIHFYFIFLFLF